MGNRNSAISTKLVRREVGEDAVEPGWDRPCPLAEEADQGWEQDQAHNGRVEQHGDGQADAELAGVGYL